jgi:hypothetical protein
MYLLPEVRDARPYKKVRLRTYFRTNSMENLQPRNLLMEAKMVARCRVQQQIPPRAKRRGKLWSQDRLR